jgi:hypothetical protein
MAKINVTGADITVIKIDLIPPELMLQQVSVIQEVESRKLLH